jgi:thiol:disulfide interchange protein DsbD
MEGLISQFDYYLQQAPVMAVGVAFLAGIVTSFTPCVYPLIPITVGFIGARGSTTKLRGFYLSLFYVLGLAIVYSLLGVVASLSGQLFGRISTSPLAYLVVANVCIFFGLAMLDVFQLSFDFLSKYSPQPGKSRGGGGALILGASSALVAGPCTTPVLGTLLAYVGTRQNVVLGILMLFFFSVGMGFLLIVVGTFTGLLSSIPKSGVWMVRVKKGFGFLMIGVGEYFLIKMGQLLL